MLPLRGTYSAGCPQSRPADAFASTAEPASVRTGWALTAATHRKRGSQGEQTREARLRGLPDYGGSGAPDRELRPTVILIENGGIITSMKKLLFIIPSVLLLLAAGTLVLCKHHAERTGLACMDIDM